MKYGYLLTGLGVPEGSKGYNSYHITRTGRKVKQHYLRAAREALKSLKCTLKTVLIIDEHGNPFMNEEVHSRRHVIVFDDGYERDDLSEMLADAFQGAFLLSTRYLPHEEPIYLLKFPLDLLMQRNKLSLLKLERYHTSFIGYFEFLSFDKIVSNCLTLRIDCLRNMFRLVPVLANNEKFLLSSGFLVISYRDFCILNTADVIEDPYFVPPTRFEKCDFENALHNAFKSIEAIIGEPPKKKSKLINKFINAGIDPNKKMKTYDPDNGEFREKTYFELLRKFRKLRDKNSAHGSTNYERRKITCLKLYEYQALAWNILWSAIEAQQKKM